jgi:mRNA interferase HigB
LADKESGESSKSGEFTEFDGFKESRGSEPKGGPYGRLVLVFFRIACLTFEFPSWEHKIVNVVSRRALLAFAARHRDADELLDAWYRRVRKAAWKNIDELHADFAQADLVGCCTVFNIGKRYSLITWVNYWKQAVSIRNVMTHAEYDRGAWRNDCRN